MQQLQNCLLDKDMILQSDGTLYIGSFNQQHLEGYSLVINPDGSYYYGFFKRSKPKDVGVYKLKNSCLKLFWGDDDTIKNVENIENIGFMQKIIPFKNNCYGNKLLIRINPLSYGVAKNQKYDGFTVMHYKNGDIYYGNVYKGKQNGEGIHYNNYLQEWYWNKYTHGKLMSHQLYGKNLVPRELISKLFNKVNFKPSQITMVSLSNIQQLIINQLLLNSEQNHLSLASTVQSAHPAHRENLSQILIDEDDINNADELEILQDSQIVSNDQDLQIYNQNDQQDELEAKLSKCQTEKALLRIEKQRQNKFLTQPSQSKSPKNIRQQNTTLTTMQSAPKITIYKRSVSPVFTTIRHLFSVIRI
ncbi:unnamed protein product [Paramecium octaurelia]|uniref:Uncharacterized protein n=1 Tax=Paramecium octaurelia TaxID=43137 RepID=A0A8S1U241_PAROT|nr:unnamed protein product [Paramecium octaurelia]